MALLDLQSNLQSEILAKDVIRKELSYSKAKQVEMEKYGLLDICLFMTLNKSENIVSMNGR